MESNKKRELTKIELRLYVKKLGNDNINVQITSVNGPNTFHQLYPNLFDFLYY